MDWGLGNPNKTAALIAILMVAVWSLAYLRKWGFWVSLILFSGLGICLVHTFSRGGMVALFTGLIPLLFFAQRPWERKKIVGVILGVWLIAGASIYLDAHKRYEMGIVQEDRSISNRLELWKTVPTMMVDAPDGWGWGNAGKAYMEWYQPLNRHESYRTLVNSHLTWMVEMNWTKRFFYLLGWIAVFVVCFPVKGYQWTTIPFSMWVTFGVASFFSSVAELAWLWIIPGCALLLMIGWRIARQQWPSGKVWALPPLGAGMILLAVSLLGSRSDVWKSGNAVTFGSHSPETWVLVNEKVLGGSYGRQLREFGLLHRTVSVGLAQSAADLPPGQIAKLFVTGGCEKSELQAAIQKLEPNGDLVLVNPTMAPQELGLSEHDLKRISVLSGEFAQSSRAAFWRDVVPVEQISEVGDFVSNWPTVYVTIEPASVASQVREHVELRIDSASPDTSDKGDLDHSIFREDGGAIEYEAKGESASDRAATTPELQDQTITLNLFLYDSEVDEVELQVKSAFHFLTNRSQYDQAISYVSEKYGVGYVATYDPTYPEAGGTSVYLGLTVIGPNGMTTENLVASTMFHEAVHRSQSISQRTQMQLGMQAYESDTINVITKPYIEMYAACELAAYYTEFSAVP